MATGTGSTREQKLCPTRSLRGKRGDDADVCRQRQPQGRSRCALFVPPRTFRGRHISRAVLHATDVCLCIAGICPPWRRPS
jgi:hypothetical protein